MTTYTLNPETQSIVANGTRLSQKAVLLRLEKAQQEIKIEQAINVGLAQQVKDLQK